MSAHFRAHREVLVELKLCCSGAELFKFKWSILTPKSEKNAPGTLKTQIPKQSDFRYRKDI